MYTTRKNVCHGLEGNHVVNLIFWVELQPISIVGLLILVKYS